MASTTSKKHQVRLVATEFATNTSGHGYRNLVQAGHVVRYALWVLLILGAMCGLGYHLYLLASQFFAYEKRVLTNHRIEPLDFPKVVLCPTTYWSDYLMTQPGAQFVRRLRAQLFNETAGYVESDAERESLVDKMLLDTYIEGRLPELDNSTAPLSAFLLSCSFNYGSCSALNFTRVVSDRYGFCYLFRPDSRQIYGGYDSGLTLTLAYEGSQEAYMTSGLRYTRGYIFLVNSYDKFVNFFRATPAGASAGFRTDVSMLLQRNSRLSSPKDKCSDKHQVVDQVGDKAEFDFDTVNCVDMSLSRNVNRRCGCVSDLLPVPPDLASRPRCMRLAWNRTVDGTGAAVTNLTSVFTHRACQDAMIRSYEDLTMYAKHVEACQKACREDTIMAQAAMSLLPTGATWTRDVERLMARRWLATSGALSFLPAIVNTTSGTALPGINLLEHVVQVNLFFASATVTEFEEGWQYETESFLSEGGATLGLWMGASILTVVEVVEFFAFLFMVPFSNKTDAAKNGIVGNPVQVRPAEEQTPGGNKTADTGASLEPQPDELKVFTYRNLPL